MIHRRFVVDYEEFSEADSIIVVDGDDLAERKQKLLENASCVVVLPGGIGTLDELCDLGCQKQLKFSKVSWDAGFQVRLCARGRSWMEVSVCMLSGFLMS